MENSILNAFPVDPGILILVLLALTIIMTITTLICAAQYRKLYRRYDLFMRGKDAETMEDILMDLVDEVDDLKGQEESNAGIFEESMKHMKTSYQKTGIVKYNAFKGMGGNLSFALAMLDQNNSGFILNCVHSTEGSYIYLRTVDEGKTEVVLGSEEQQALEQALGYIGKPGRSRMRASKETEKNA
jgi:hypothetical protein